MSSHGTNVIIDNLDAIAVKKLGRMQKRIQQRREWLESILGKHAIVSPYVQYTNPQAIFRGALYIDDIDMMVIESMKSWPSMSMSPNHSDLVGQDTKAQSFTCMLEQSIAYASANIQDICVYGWALQQTMGSELAPIVDLPCIPIVGSKYTTPRGAARLVCNALAALNPQGTIPSFVAIYSPKMKRLSGYKVNSKFCNSQNLANETNLSCASKKISRISLAEASKTCLVLNQ